MKKICLCLFKCLTSALAASILLLSSISNANGWAKASSGKSSFRDLGDIFSVPVPVAHIEGARLVLFNHKLAEKLGLTALDETHLQKLLLGNFAMMVTTEEKAERFFFSTYSTEFRPDGATENTGSLGDGRVTWSGEIILPLANGQTIYLDVSLKGVGRTPLAKPFEKDAKGNITNLQYSDGLQTMSEGARSFIASQAVDGNGVNAVVDLAVFELPLKKVDPFSEKLENASLTVRVGNQTRISQFEFHHQSPENFKIFFNYAVKRNLGLPLTTAVDTSHVEKYLVDLNKALATQAAYFVDLAFVHGSPTAGNQTTAGMPIDYGTFMAMDAHHGEMAYMNGQLFVKDQSMVISNYMGLVTHFMELPSYPGVTPLNLNWLYSEFDLQFKKVLTELWLERLGLTSIQIKSLSAKDKRLFYIAANSLQTSAERTVKFYGGEIKPSAFDMRKVFRESIRVSFMDPEKRMNAWISVLTPSQNWNANKRKDFRRRSAFANRYLKEPKLNLAMRIYLYQLTEMVNHLQLPQEAFNEMIERAKYINRPSRIESTFPDLSPLIKHMRDPDQTYTQNNAEAQKLIDSLVDRPQNGCRTLLNSIKNDAGLDRAN